MKLAAVFARAISQAGATTTLYRQEQAVGNFPASLQPVGTPGELEHSSIGGYPAGRYTLYAGCGGTAGHMRTGDSVETAGRRYYVRSVQPVLLRGRTIYHKASLSLEEE